MTFNRLSHFSWQIIILVAVTAYLFRHNMPVAHAEKGWLTTNATVIDSQVIKRTRTHAKTHRINSTFTAKVTYQYQVDKQTHMGEFYRWVERGDSKKVETLIAKHYPKDSAITVYYHPDKPQKSVYQK